MSKTCADPKSKIIPKGWGICMLAGGGGEAVEAIFGNLLCEFRKFEFSRHPPTAINLSTESIHC